MGGFVAERVVKMLTRKRVHVVGAKVLILGLAFKENCPDLRNTRVVDIVVELESYHAKVEIYDPWVDKEQAQLEYGITSIDLPKSGRYDAIILAVSHTQFVEPGGAGIRAFGTPESILYDIKSVLPKSVVDARL